MIHNKNNHTVGETKSTNSVTATTRVCLQKLPQYMRLQVFHSLTDLDYFYIRLTCKTFLRDYVFSVKYNFISPCLFVPSVACKTLKEALAKAFIKTALLNHNPPRCDMLVLMIDLPTI